MKKKEEFPIGDIDEKVLDGIWMEIRKKKRAKTTIAKALFSGVISISKAKEDLVKKVIIDKNGHRKTVWVKREEEKDSDRGRGLTEEALLFQNVSVGNSHGRVLSKIDEDAYLVVDYETGEINVHSEKELQPADLTEDQILKYFDTRVEPSISENPKFYQELIKDTQETYPAVRDLTDIIAISGTMYFMNTPDYKLRVRYEQGLYRNQIFLLFFNEDVKITRLLKLKKQNYLEAVFFDIANHLQGKGIGTQVAYDMVKNCERLGIPEIQLEAGKDEDMNGYYTWAILGYEIKGDIDQKAFQDFIEYHSGDYPELKNITTLNGLMAAGFRELWKEYGFEFWGSMDTNNKEQVGVIDKYYKRKIPPLYASKKKPIKV